MELQDGSIETFEVSMERFNELRYGVAKVSGWKKKKTALLPCHGSNSLLLGFHQALQQMRRIESHPIMKMAFDTDKAKVDGDMQNEKKTKK